MTKILIGRDYIEISGHSPDPAVCHGISAISQMVGNYVTEHHWGTVEAADGYLKISNIYHKYLGDALFIAMVDALTDIRKEYPGALEIEYEK